MKTNRLALAIPTIGLSALLMGCQSHSEADPAVVDAAADTSTEATSTQPRYWNYFWMRGRPSIDVAMFNYGQNLTPQGSDELRGFEVAGKDRRFYPAHAELTSQIVEEDRPQVSWVSLKSDDVKEPYYIRYAMGDNKPRANLVNELGERAAAFTTLPKDSAP